jgi:hypothetical protein
MFDADMLSKVTRGLGTPTTWVGNNTQEASNANPNNRYDFDYSAAYDQKLFQKQLERCQSQAVLGFRQFQGHALITWLWVGHQLGLL